MTGKAGQIAIAVTPMVTGTLSILASSTVIKKVLKSESRMKNPYNRLLVGLCVFDIIASSTHVASTLPSPRDMAGRWGAIGNDTTCEIQGFLMLLSIVSTPLYNLALCIYFLCVINYCMTDQRFGCSVEPYLHALPILYGLATSIYTLCLGYINPSTTTCWIGAPNDPEGDAFSQKLVWIINGIPILLIFFSIVAIMCMIAWQVYKQERTMERYRFQLNSGLASALRNSARSQENASRSRNRLRAAQTRAKWFFLAYFATYAPSYACQIIEQVMGLGNVPIALALGEKVFLPLQGVFNMCAHLQPQAATIQRENPDYWFIQALFVALTTLDTDLDNRGSRRRSTRTGRRRSRLRDSINLPPRDSFADPKQRGSGTTASTRPSFVDPKQPGSGTTASTHPSVADPNLRGSGTTASTHPSVADPNLRGSGTTASTRPENMPQDLFADPQQSSSVAAVSTPLDTTQ